MTKTNDTTQIAREIKNKLDQLKKLQKIIKQLLQTPEQRVAIDNAAKALDVAIKQNLISAQHASLQKALADKATELSRNIRADLVAALSTKLDTQVKVLSEKPLEIDISPLTVLVDFERDRATLCYAREPIEAVTLDAAAIVAMRTQIAEHIKATRLESAVFTDILYKAYRITLVMQERKIGDRIDLVHLIPALSMLLPQPKNASYPRYMLAYQLQRMRRDSSLSIHGQRLLLGTATGGSARQKKNVLYIPHGGNDGQYYLSICFRSE